jgi:hypothetical protein
MQALSTGYSVEMDQAAGDERITMPKACGFDEAWIGKCKEAGDPFCAKHTGRVCVSCGAIAVRNCEETGQFVCGENLCGDCEHTIFPSGTNGGIGFNAEPLPEGMRRHCKKTEQRYQPWYAREAEANQQ